MPPLASAFRLTKTSSSLSSELVVDALQGVGLEAAGHEQQIAESRRLFAGVVRQPPLPSLGRRGRSGRASSPPRRARGRRRPLLSLLLAMGGCLSLAPSGAN